MTNIVDNEVEKEEEKEFDFLASAFTILGNTTQSSYKKRKKELVEQFKLPPEKFPSCYLLTQSRPDIITFTFKYDEFFYKTLHIPVDVDIEDSKLDEIVLTPKEVLSTTSFIGNRKYNFSDAIENVWKSKKSEDVVIRAKLKGGYKDYVIMMFDKHIRGKSDISGNVLVINSYHDAVHNQTKKEEIV